MAKDWIPWQILMSLSWNLKTTISNMDIFQDLERTDCSWLLKMFYFPPQENDRFFFSININQITYIKLICSLVSRRMLHLNDLYRSLRLLSCHYLSDGYSIEFLCINSSVQSRNEVASMMGQTQSTNSSIKMQIFKTITMYLKVTNLSHTSKV